VDVESHIRFPAEYKVEHFTIFCSICHMAIITKLTEMFDGVQRQINYIWVLSRFWINSDIRQIHLLHSDKNSAKLRFGLELHCVSLCPLLDAVQFVLYIDIYTTCTNILCLFYKT